MTTKERKAELQAQILSYKLEKTAYCAGIENCKKKIAGLYDIQFELLCGMHKADKKIDQAKQELKAIK